MCVEGLLSQQGCSCNDVGGLSFYILSGNVSKNIQVRPIDILFQACLMMLIAYQFSFKNSYHGKSWSNMLSFKTCNQTLKDANQHYAIFLSRLQPSRCKCECFHLAIFSETLRIERAILSEFTCTRFFWKSGSFWHIMYHIKANWKDQCVQTYYIVRASVTRIVFSSQNLGCLQVKCWK